MRPAITEFWLDDKPFSSVDGSHAFVVGHMVVIRNVKYHINSIQWCVDYSDDYDNRQLRCCVNLRKVK